MTGEWMRAQGLGRERLGSYLADYLRGRGYGVVIAEVEGSSRITARVERPHPSIPPGLGELAFSISPSSGGSVLTWDGPEAMPSPELPRADRFAQEISQHLVRLVLTQSHGVARLKPAPNAAAPWRRPPADRSSTPIRKAL
jgi:hypothetical protein